MLCFSAIHILLTMVTFICGLYSIREYRYTYKRLTGMIYILAGKRSIFSLVASTSPLFYSSCFAARVP